MGGSKATECSGLHWASLSEVELLYLEQIYTESFPIEERRPWKDLLEGCGEDFSIRVLRHQGQVCGLMSFWRLSLAIFVEHLVVSSAWRGLGLGAHALQSLLEEANTLPLVLEVEPRALSHEAERRCRFYERLGLKVLPIDYTQPSYHAGGESLPLNLMSNHTLAPSDFQPIIDELYRVVYRITQ